MSQCSVEVKAMCECVETIMIYRSVNHIDVKCKLHNWVKLGYAFFLADQLMQRCLCHHILAP